MNPLAHIGGLPLEETVVQSAPAVLAAVVALRLTAERMRRWAGRVARLEARSRRAGGSRP